MRRSIPVRSRFSPNRRDSLRAFNHDCEHAGGMETVAALLKLVRAIRETPNTAATRDVLERFDRGEIGPSRAAWELQQAWRRAEFALRFEPETVRLEDRRLMLTRRLRREVKFRYTKGRNAPPATNSIL
jgi:hypothetical protein